MVEMELPRNLDAMLVSIGIVSGQWWYDPQQHAYLHWIRFVLGCPSCARIGQQALRTGQSRAFGK